MRRSVSIAGLVFVVTSAVAYANPELLRLQTDDKQWVMPGKDYSATRLHVEPDHQGQRQESAARVDVLDRDVAGPRGSAAGRRLDDVRAHVVPQQRLRPRIEWS